MGVSDPNAVLRASRICDETGMDTISAGATVAWAIESFERGVLDPDVAAGFDLRFGDGEGLLACLSMISERRGIGDLLAEGSRIASRRVGRGSDAWAMHVKGLEMPGYEPRSLKTMALGLAVSTRGACHNRSSAYEADFSSRVDRLGVDDQRGPHHRRGRGSLVHYGLVALVQVPPQGVRRPDRGVRRHLRARHRVVDDPRRAETGRGADKHRQEAFQHPRGLDRRGRTHCLTGP